MPRITEEDLKISHETVFREFAYVNIITQYLADGGKCNPELIHEMIMDSSKDKIEKLMKCNNIVERIDKIMFFYNKSKIINI